MNTLQRPIPQPTVEIRNNRTLRRQVLWQCIPAATTRKHVEDTVKDFAHIHLSLAPSKLDWWNEPLHQLPFPVARIARITQPIAIRHPTMLHCPYEHLFCCP